MDDIIQPVLEELSQFDHTQREQDKLTDLGDPPVPVRHRDFLPAWATNDYFSVAFR